MARAFNLQWSVIFWYDIWDIASEWTMLLYLNTAACFSVTTKHRPFVCLIVWTVTAGSPLQNWHQNCTGVTCHGLCINSLNGNDSLKRFEGVCHDIFFLFHICSSQIITQVVMENTINWPEFKDFKNNHWWVIKTQQPSAIGRLICLDVAQWINPFNLWGASVAT